MDKVIICSDLVTKKNTFKNKDKVIGQDASGQLITLMNKVLLLLDCKFLLLVLLASRLRCTINNTFGKLLGFTYYAEE